MEPESIVALRETIRLKPDLANAHSNLGVALTKQGKFEEAVAEFREAIRLKPAHAAAHVNLGNALREREKFEEAVSSTARRSGSTPTTPSLMTTLVSI